VEDRPNHRPDDDCHGSCRERRCASGPLRHGLREGLSSGSRDWSFIYGHRFSFSFSRDIAKA
jgi:hypothetical protein